jgi:hypothetical protein
MTTFPAVSSLASRTFVTVIIESLTSEVTRVRADKEFIARARQATAGPVSINDFESQETDLKVTTRRPNCVRKSWDRFPKVWAEAVDGFGDPDLANV